MHARARISDVQTAIASVALVIGMLVGGLWLLVALVKFMWEHS